LVSGGFVFPEGERGDRYVLKFIASPQEPAVEHDLLEFLAVIESEMRLRNSLLPKCAKRWQDFVLPFSIDRADIISDGYKYGEHRFTLEQRQILDLLVGENIYDDPYVFVRELVQNSIDATRHREFYELATQPGPYKPKPIQLSSWQDRDGYLWMRIDDNGMGMDENIVSSKPLRGGRCSRGLRVV
jgi:hypothetical protein